MSILSRYNSNARHHAVFVGLSTGTLSQGQAAKLLGMDPVSIREVSGEYLEVCRELWAEYRETGRTIADLRRDEAAATHSHRCCCSD